MRPPHTQIIFFHNEPPFHSCIYYIVIDDEYQKFKLIISSSTSGLSASFYHTLGTFPGLRITAAMQTSHIAAVIDSLMLFFLLSTDTGKVYNSSKNTLHAICTNVIQNRKCVQYFTAVCAKFYRMADNCLLFQVAVLNFDNQKIRKPVKMKREKRPLCHTKRKGGCFPKHRFTGQDIFI